MEIPDIAKFDNITYTRLNSLVEKHSFSGINLKPGTEVSSVLDPNNSIPLESDVDEQIIFNISFTQPVRIHSIKIGSTETNAPKIIKLYINIVTLGFEDVGDLPPTQTITVHEDFYNSGDFIPLQYVKFQSVKNISIFIENNLKESDTTSIQKLAFYGHPIHYTKMDLLNDGDE